MSECFSVNAKIGAIPAILSCPENGARSKQVDIVTVRALVRTLPLGMPNTQYYFCDAPDCDLVYFPLDTQARRFHRGDLMVRVGAKETADPIQLCYCFGFTRKDIENEIAETGCSKLLDRIKTDVNAGRCACHVKNPSGKCCLGDVTRTAMRRLSQKGAFKL